MFPPVKSQVIVLSKEAPIVSVGLRIVRDFSAVRLLFFQLAGAVGRQRALHTENRGFTHATLPWHISTFHGYWILFSIRNLYVNRFTNPFLFIHNHLTFRKSCYTPLLHNFTLDPLILSFHFHFRTFVT